MTAPVHSTAAEAPIQMPGSAEPEQAATTAGQTVVQAGAGVGRRALRQLGENPLLAGFGAALVALLIFNLSVTHERITRLEDSVIRLEERMDARFTALEEDVAEINLKLTALIAALNMTDEVTAAIEGRLIDRSPDAGPADTAPG